MATEVFNEGIRVKTDPRFQAVSRVVSAWTPPKEWFSSKIFFGVLTCFILGGVVFLQHELDQRLDHTREKTAQLRLMVRGESLKPALLGFNHLGADFLWLQIIQVLGNKEMRQEDHEWLHHALNVVTTLDPHYVYAYDIGGLALTEIAGRVDWGNELLEKGIAVNPTAWRLPFQLGFNQFFYQQDYVHAAESMVLAARLPGRPAYVPELAARLYVQGKRPELALQFLRAMLSETHDEQTRQTLERRAREVMIERDIDHMDAAMTAFFDRFDQPPQSFSELIQAQLLSGIPVEPFGGEYLLDFDHGTVTSSTHPTRLRIHSPPIQ